MPIPKTRSIRLAVASCLLVLLLSGCSGTLAQFFGFAKTERPDVAAEQLAAEGLDKFQTGDYHDALEKFEKIKDRYPFSNVSLLAELKAADSHYHMEHYREALTLYEEFENNHPTNEAAPYVLFQIGMCHFKQMDTVDRDISSASSAIQAFSRLLRSFPDSPYTEEARQRVKTTENALAEHEFYVATFYLRTQKQEQALTRLKHLIATYPAANIVPEAQKLLDSLRDNIKIKRGWRSWLPFYSTPY